MKNKINNSHLGIILLFLSGLCSCSDRPSNMLSEREMVNLLVDMQLTEAYVNFQMATSSKEQTEIGKQVLYAHGVSEEELDTTLAWYGRNMDEYSKLFEKVDKEILKRKDKYADIPGGIKKNIDELWPYNSHIYISQVSGYESFIFSISDPKVEAGELLKLSFSLPNPSSIKGTFGVEYTNGDGEAIVNNFNNKRKIEIEVQTDSSKIVSRLFGVMDIKDSNVLPFYIDSISLIKEPLDSLKYRAKRRNQKYYGIITHQKVKEYKEKEDSISSILEDNPEKVLESRNGIKRNSEIPINTRPLRTSDNSVRTRPEGEFEKLEKN